MAMNTILQQGRFTSDGSAKTLNVRSDVDWMKVYNYTQAAATNDVGLEYYWQRGMADDTGLAYSAISGNNTIVLNAIVSSGFTLVDQSANAEFGAAVAITSNTNVVQPVFTVASTAALTTGDVVKIAGTAGSVSLNGYDFEITVINGTTFKPTYALATAPGNAGTGGTYRLRNRVVNFVPQQHFIADVSSAANAVVTLTEDHSYSVGDYVRFNFPSSVYVDFNTNWNGLSAKITAVGTATVTVDASSSSFSAYVSAVDSNFPTSPATLALYGGNVNASTDNTGELQMKLAGGQDNPGGATSDVMYWVAGKSFNVNNE